MNHVALRRLIVGSLLVWVMGTIVLTAHLAPSPQHVGAQEAPTATAEVAPEQAVGPIHLPLITQGLQVIPEPTPTPNIPVIAPGDAEYVELSWEDSETSAVDRREIVLRAYNKGYNADTGDPVSDIIIAFGRQVDPADIDDGCLDDNMWGVQLVDQAPLDTTGCRGIRDINWVKRIADNYILGYYANPDHSRLSVVGIGTSNGNFPWTCNDESWNAAGRAWREVVEDISTSAIFFSDKVSVRSAIDVESWFGEYDPTDEYPEGWVACGSGAVAWFRGYESRSGTIFSMNFGSNAFNEYSPAWTRDQVYDVFSGRATALAYPQIYCGSQVTNNIGQQATQWAEYARDYPDLVFFGVTSENATNSRCPNNTSLTWNEAWQELDAALAAENLNGRLLMSVVSFYFP